MDVILQDNKMSNISPHKLTVFLTCLYFILSPIELGLNALSPSGSSVKYIMLIIIALGFLKNRLVISQTNKGIFLWLLIALISISWSKNIDDAIYYFKMYLLSGTFYFVIISFNFTSKDIEKFLFCLIIGSTVAASFMLLNPSLLYATDYRYTLTMFGVQMDPNGAAALISYGYVIALYQVLNRKAFKYINIIFVIICFLGALYTGSRGGLLTIFITSISILFFTLLKAKKGYKKLIKIFAFSLITIVLLYASIKFLPTDVLFRLLNFENYSGGSERTTIWSSYIGDIYPIFGNGIGSMNILSLKNMGHVSGTHNTYLQLIVDNGIVGLICILYTIYILFKKSIKLNESKLLAIVLITTATLPAFFLDSLQQRNFWIGLILAALIIKNEDNCKKIRQNDYNNKSETVI